MIESQEDLTTNGVEASTTSMIKMTTMTPVSYTHLDVYKRQ